MRGIRFNYICKYAALSAFCLVWHHGNAQQQLVTGEMPQAWTYTESFDQQLPTDDEWWKTFGDATLDSLISIGVDNNFNVLQAQRRIEMARQALRQTQSAYYPQFDLNGGWTKARTSGMNGPQPAKAVASSYFDLGVSMNWEIDVFGKIYSRAKESKANFQATRAEYQAVMVTMCSKIATAYFQLRALQAQLELLNHHIASQKRIVEITEARHEAGLASMLDVAQAKTTYFSTLASVASIKSSETATLNSLAVLLGEFPDQLGEKIRQSAPLPDYHQIVAVGVPMELLRRRPDIVEAEYQLAGYAAALGVAKKDFLPTLSLSGSIGTAAHDASDLFKDQSFTYTIAPTLSWTIFDGLGRKSAVESAKEQMMAGIDNYNLAVLTAVQEVETAMASYVNDLQYIKDLEEVVEQAHESLVLSVDLYKQGLTAFINVTNSQITLLQYANQLVVARGQALSDLATLYEALGGGMN